MTIKLVNRGTEAEVLLGGRLDSATAPEAEAIFKDIGERFDRVILNMATLEYISSAGLRLILMLDKTMHGKSGEMIIKNVNKMIMEVFEMVGFVGHLRIL